MPAAKRAALPPESDHEPPETPADGGREQTAETGTGEQHQEQPTPPPPPSATGGRRARSRRDRKPNVDWTGEAKALRAALSAYQAQLRKLDERRREVRRMARKVPADQVPAIVHRVAQDTDANRKHLADAAGAESDT